MRLLIFGFVLSFILACNSGTEKDIPPINKEFDIIRIDQSLFSLDTNAMIKSLEQCSAKHPAFSELYFKQILPLGASETTEELSEELKTFLGDKNIQWLRDTCQQIYPNLNFLKDELSPAFARYNHFFPNRDIPDIYSFISAFQFQRFIFKDEKGKDAVGLGLDLFLGEEFPYQQLVPNNPNFSKYLSWTFSREFISVKIMELLIDDLMGEPKGNRLLDYMIHHGKKWYILQQVLPDKEFYRIVQLKEDQLAWCRENEMELWAYFLSEELFYESSFLKIAKLIQPSPVAPSGMPAEAPGMTANYIGWRIVQSYLKRFPRTTLQQLLAKEDAQQILDSSKFKPRNR